MTSSLRPDVGRPAAARRGFTLIEMLVVIGIILLLISILLPALNRAYRDASRNAMAADLQTISQALDVYREAFGDYPRPTASGIAPQTLCWALAAPGSASQDGADGPGFRVRSSQGKVYGPYVPLDRFKVAYMNGSTVTTATTTFDDTVDLLCDRYGVPILYFPANTHAVLTDASNGGSVGPGVYGTNIGRKPYLNWSDMPTGISGSSNLVSSGQTNTTLQHYLMYVVGDTNLNGKIDAGEGLATSAPFILWSAGPDAVFGPTLSSSKVSVRSDDVFNVPLNDPLPGTQQ